MPGGGYQGIQRQKETKSKGRRGPRGDKCQGKDKAERRLRLRVDQGKEGYKAEMGPGPRGC